MRIGRTIPPAAACLTAVDALRGIAGALVGKRAIHALEEDFRRELGVRHVFALSSGTAALLVTLKALRTLSTRREVVMPAFTCYSVAAAVVQAGLTPVLCDVDPESFDFSEPRLGEAVSGRTLCVIAHHLFGVPAAVARVRRISERHGAYVVEDAAQALGIDTDGRPLGTLGDAGIFSFGRGKHVTSGSGGMAVTNSAAIAAAIERQCERVQPPSRLSQAIDGLTTLLMLVFIRPWLYWVPAALPFLSLGRTVYPSRITVRRLSGFQAGLLRHWRARLTRSNDVRREAVSYFRRTLPAAGPGGEPRPYLRFPVVARDSATQQRVCSLARRRGLGITGAYPTPINEIPEIASVFDGQRFPVAVQLSERLLTLPTHHWVSERDKRAIAAVCRGLVAA